MGQADAANSPLLRSRPGTDRDPRCHAGDDRHGTDPLHGPGGARRGARAHRSDGRLAWQIKQMFRSPHILATALRDEMLKNGRGDEREELIR